MPRTLIATVVTASLVVFGLTSCGNEKTTIESGIASRILHVEKTVKKNTVEVPVEFVQNGKVRICHGREGRKHIIEPSVNAVPAHIDGKGNGHRDDYLIAVESWSAENAPGSDCPNVPAPPPAGNSSEGGMGGSGAGGEGGSGFGSGGEGGSGSGSESGTTLNNL